MAGDAKEQMLRVEQREFDEELILDRLIEEISFAHGVVAARVLGRDGTIFASMDAQERDATGVSLASEKTGPDRCNR